MIFLNIFAPLMRMRTPSTILAAMLLMAAVNLFPQQQSITDYLAHCEIKYGSDADLVNGEKYSYPYSQALGDPFFFPESRTASITIHEKEFKGQLLRYDIFNQQLILDYENLYGVSASLVLRSEWVESFAFDNQKFKKIEGPEGKSDYFQILGEGQIDCIYLWSKKYLLSLTSGEQSYYFTDPDRSSFLRIEGQVHPYKSNGNFIKAFDPGLQKPIKKFLKQAKIKVKTASDVQMRHLLEYCNTLSHEN